jgi:signal transduction histidine kinase
MRDLRRVRLFLAQPRSDPAIAVALTTACLLELFTRSGMTNSPLAIIEIVLLCAPLTVLRSHPVIAACVASLVLLLGPSFDGRFPGFVPLLVECAFVYRCGTHAAPRAGGLAVGALAVAMQVRMGFSEFPNLEIAFVTLGPFWVGHQVRVRNQLVSRLAQRTRELSEEQDAFVRLSVRRERGRIARELHDIVAHHLAVIVVQAGAGRIAWHAPSEQAVERFSTIRQSGGQALSEMARLVDILHADAGGDHGTADTLALLVDEATAGGLEVRVMPVPPGAQLPAEIENDAYRIVREALTNAIKHAPGAEVQVRLALHTDELEIEVRDGGARRPTRLADTGAGLGLTGMRELVESIGGTLETGPARARGWRVRAVLPIAASIVIPTR